MFHLLLILWAEHVASLQYSKNLHLFLNSPLPSLRKSCTQEVFLKKKHVLHESSHGFFVHDQPGFRRCPDFLLTFFPAEPFTCRLLHRNGCHMEVTTSNHAWWSSQLRCKRQVVREGGSNCLLIMGRGFLKPVVEPLLCQRTGYYPISVWVTTKYNKDIQKVQMSVKLNKRQKMAMFKLPVDSLSIPNGRSSNAWIGYIYIYICIYISLSLAQPNAELLPLFNWRYLYSPDRNQTKAQMEPASSFFWELDSFLQPLLPSRQCQEIKNKVQRSPQICRSGWWFQPIWKKLVKLEIFPK